MYLRLQFILKYSQLIKITPRVASFLLNVLNANNMYLKQHKAIGQPSAQHQVGSKVYASSVLHMHDKTSDSKDRRLIGPKLTVHISTHTHPHPYPPTPHPPTSMHDVAGVEVEHALAYILQVFMIVVGQGQSKPTLATPTTDNAERHMHALGELGRARGHRPSWRTGHTACPGP